MNFPLLVILNIADEIAEVIIKHLIFFNDILCIIFCTSVNTFKECHYVVTKPQCKIVHINKKL